MTRISRVLSLWTSLLILNASLGWSAPMDLEKDGRGLKRTRSSSVSLNSMNLDPVEEEPRSGLHLNQQQQGRPLSPFAASKHVLPAPTQDYLDAVRNGDTNRLIQIMSDLPPSHRKLRGLLVRLWISTLKNKDVERLWHHLRSDPHVLSDPYFWDEMGLYVSKHPYSGIRSEIVQTLLDLSDSNLRSMFFERLVGEGIQASALVEEWTDSVQRSRLFERIEKEYEFAVDAIKTREASALWVGNNLRSLDRQDAIHPLAGLGYLGLSPVREGMVSSTPTGGRRRSGSVESSYIPPSTLDQALQRVMGDSPFSRQPNYESPFSRHTMDYQQPSLVRNARVQEQAYGASPPVRHLSGSLPRLPSIGERMQSPVHAHGALHLFPM